MIFYFTGTGNSLFVAKKLVEDNEQFINIADCLNDNTFTFNISEEEKVGFVFPVYFYTVPTIIRDFISKLTLTGDVLYVYGVITCGGGISQAGAVLKKLLSEKNITLNYVTSMLMPDNSMLFYQIPGTDRAGDRLNNADKACKELKLTLEAREINNPGNVTVISDLIGLGYKACMNTSKFYADDRCISCGLCARDCPEKAIELVSGKPSWVKDKCTKCSRCINSCPVASIQYGKSTINRNRYKNPQV